MLLKSMVYKKENLTTVKETNTLREALDILEESGFRCVPILDETGRI
ncbi:CBS domain-containing protein, partial [Enterococcus cecorum]